LNGQVPYIQEPALVLSQVVSPASQEADPTPGFLTLTEVMNLKLNTELVALTACSTGVGKQVTGEGVMGLGRAFQYAGARGVLMSLWNVDEASTVLLVERFFGYLQQGKNTLEALRLARAEVRQAGYEHPFFWAPFILVGER
jgi:CHAT domain-containing protein